ncbi:MAG: hypothetical protein HGA33_05165 [Candidatus Moranbacteria bacterium]|nr:hypothetical protein [Candidatus Moranbacteria bacterium]
MKLEIKNLYCPSWNDIKDWRKRSALMKEIKELVCAEFLQAGSRRWNMKTPVTITIDARFKGSQRRDPDNLYVKPIIDGMVAAKVIPDDNGRIVKWVKNSADWGFERDVVTITVESIEEPYEHRSLDSDTGGNISRDTDEMPVLRIDEDPQRAYRGRKKN